MTAATQTVPTSIKLDSDIKQRMQQLANLRHRSAHSLMQEAIMQYLEREEQLEQFRDEMEDAWLEYQASGQHVTGQEMFAWMETWFTDQEGAAPKCHH